MRGSLDKPQTYCKGPGGCSGTVTVPDDYLPNIRQRQPYGTTNWVTDYYRRNSVDSANSQLRVNQPLKQSYTRLAIDDHTPAHEPANVRPAANLDNI